MSQNHPVPDVVSRLPGGTLQWTEPIFFRLRSASSVSWIVRVVVACLLFNSLRNMEPNPNVVRLMAIAVGLVALYEAAMLQRTIVISDRGIECAGIFIKTGSPLLRIIGTVIWNRYEIKSIELLRPATVENKFGCSVIVVMLKHGSPKWLGVASQVSLEAIAERIRSLGIPVELKSDVIDAAAEPRTESE